MNFLLAKEWLFQSKSLAKPTSLAKLLAKESNPDLNPNYILTRILCASIVPCAIQPKLSQKPRTNSDPTLQYSKNQKYGTYVHVCVYAKG